MPAINAPAQPVNPPPVPEGPAPAPVEAQPLTRKQKLLAKLESLQKRIASDTEKFNELRNEYDMIDKLDNVSVGTKVVIKQGRAETTREVQGVVIAVKHDEDGTAKYKVQYGEGFDADIAVVHAAGILQVVTE